MKEKARDAERLLALLDRTALDERGEAAREEAQTLLLRRHLEALKERPARPEDVPSIP